MKQHEPKRPQLKMRLIVREMEIFRFSFFDNKHILIKSYEPARIKTLYINDFDLDNT